MDTNADFLHIGLDFISQTPTDDYSNCDKTCIDEKEKLYTDFKNNIDNDEKECNEEVTDDMNKYSMLSNNRNDDSNEELSIESFNNEIKKKFEYSLEESLLENIKNTPLINANTKIFKSICLNVNRVFNYIYEIDKKTKEIFTNDRISAMTIMYKNFLLSEDSRKYTDYDWSNAYIDKLFIGYEQILSNMKRFILNSITPDSHEFNFFVKDFSDNVMEFLLLYYKDIDEKIYSEDPEIYNNLYSLSNLIKKNRFVFYQKIYNINQKKDNIKFPGNEKSFIDLNQLKHISFMEYKLREKMQDGLLKGFSNLNKDTEDSFIKKELTQTNECLLKENATLSFVYECFIAISGALSSLLLDKHKILMAILPENY